MKGISFSAILNKITTTVDGGWSITFHVPQSETAELMKLSAHREDVLQIGVIAVLDTGPESRES